MRVAKLSNIRFKDSRIVQYDAGVGRSIGKGGEEWRMAKATEQEDDENFENCVP